MDNMRKAMAKAQSLGHPRAAGRFSFAFGRLADVVLESDLNDDVKKSVAEFVDWVLTNE